jgi:hypothetical protein
VNSLNADLALVKEASPVISPKLERLAIRQARVLCVDRRDVT